MKRAPLTLAAFLATVGIAWATVNLTTNVAIPNITRWQIVSIDEYHDAEVPRMILHIKIMSPAGLSYPPPGCMTGMTCLWDLSVTDASGPVLDVNPTPNGFTDRILLSLSGGPTGAYTAISTAMAGVSGRLTKRQAAEQACLTVGVCGAGLGGSTLR